MYGLSRAWFFSVSSALAVGAVALLAWRVFDQNPRFFSRVSLPQVTLGTPSTAPEPTPPPAVKTEPPKDIGAFRPDLPKFDVVRVEPTGETVVAGRAAPGASINLLNNGVVIARVKADENGQFALIPPALTQGDNLLSLQIDGQPVSPQSQTVAIALPKDRKGEVVVALAEPGSATRLLSDKAPSPAVAGQTPLAIRSVEVDEAGGFYATGSGRPGATIRLSLNGVPVATVQSGEEGRWSLKVERGMAAGAYAVRADELDKAGKVVAQAEVPFDYPGSRQLAAANPPTTAPAPSGGADAVVSELQSVIVQRGDSLWRISQRVLGSGVRYTQIYAANNSQIRNPSRIYPKQILVVPQGGKASN